MLTVVRHESNLMCLSFDIAISLISCESAANWLRKSQDQLLIIWAQRCHVVSALDLVASMNSYAQLMWISHADLQGRVARCNLGLGLLALA